MKSMKQINNNNHSILSPFVVEVHATNVRMRYRMSSQQSINQITQMDKITQDFQKIKQNQKSSKSCQFNSFLQFESGENALIKKASTCWYMPRSPEHRLPFPQSVGLRHSTKYFFFSAGFSGAVGGQLFRAEGVEEGDGFSAGLGSFPGPGKPRFTCLG